MICALTLVGAAPAQAVAEVDLSSTETTITLGQSFELNWTSTDAVTLTASDAWTGAKAIPNGTESITPVATGTFDYTLTAIDADQNSAVDTVTVTVNAAPITPAPVTFDGCDVTVPSTPNVTYFADYGDGDIEELEAENYPAWYFDNGGDPVLFYAEAAEGFDFADGAVTEWEFTAPEECLGGANLVTATTTCDSVTFTNITDLNVTVLFGSFDEKEEDGLVHLAAGDSHTAETDRDPVGYLAFAGEEGEGGFQTGSVDKPTGCASDHPTVAPAAGK